MERKDPLTGEVFTPKRTNQKFASRRTQIMYNNQVASQKRKAKSNTDKKLDKNRNILKTILGQEKEIIKSVDFLNGAGFDFFIQTNNLMKNGIKYICVYEFAYCLTENRKIKIFKHE